MILDISEYIDTSHGNPVEPSVAHQVLQIGPEPVSSKPFHKLTRVVRLEADVNCLVSFCNGPYAMLGAGRADLRVIQPDQAFSLSVKLASADSQSASDQVGALLRVIGDPKAAAERKADLDKLHASIKAKTATLEKKQAELHRRSAEHEMAAAAFAKEKAEYDELLASTSKDLVEREAALAAATIAFESTSVATDAALKRREGDVTRREDAIAERVRLLNDNESKMEAAMADLKRRQALLRQATE